MLDVASGLQLCWLPSRYIDRAGVIDFCSMSAQNVVAVHSSRTYFALNCGEMVTPLTFNLASFSRITAASSRFGRLV